MAEKYTLTNAIAVTSVVDYKIVELNLRFAGADSSISIGLVDNANRKSFYFYNGTDAETQLNTLNKANLTSNSLHKRILNKLVSDGLLQAGSITGLPE